MTLVSQITSASPSWRGFTKVEEIARLKAILFKACRYGYLPTDFLSLDDLLDDSDDSLFTSNTFCTNFSHHPYRPPIIFIPVTMASPFLLYPQSLCTKTFCTVSYIKIYINLKTYVIHITEIVVHIACL